MYYASTGARNVICAFKKKKAHTQIQSAYIRRNDFFSFPNSFNEGIISKLSLSSQCARPPASYTGAILTLGTRTHTEAIYGGGGGAVNMQNAQSARSIEINGIE